MATVQLGVVFLASTFSLINSAQGGCLLIPRNVTVHGVKSRNLSVRWIEPEAGDGHNITYDVFYKADGSSWQEVTDVTKKEATLTVRPYAHYEIFVMAKANDVHGVASARVNATTLPEEPGSCPEVTAAERSQNIVGVKWKRIPSDERNGRIVSYVILYKNCSMSKEENKTCDATKSKDFCEVPDLGPGPYSFRVLVENTVGLCLKGDYENQVAMTSEEYFHKKRALNCPSSSPHVTSMQSSTPLPASSSTGKSATTSSHATTQTPSPSSVTTTPVATSIVIQPPTTQKQTQVPTKSTLEPKQTHEPCVTSTQAPCECPTTQEPASVTEKPAEKLANSGENDWLKYVAIALAVIVVIMGVTILLLIWQLYRNHRMYRLQQREQGYKMKRRDKEGHDNQGQDNP